MFSKTSLIFFTIFQLVYGEEFICQCELADKPVADLYKMNQDLVPHYEKPSFNFFKISYHYVPIKTWIHRNKYEPKMQKSYYERELQVVEDAFEIFNQIFPWLEFVQSKNYSSADVRFEILSKTKVAAHTHIESRRICLGPEFWSYLNLQIYHVVHEIGHLLGLKLSSNKNHMMSGKYLMMLPSYEEYKTITYVWFGHKIYFKHLLSEDDYMVIFDRLLKKYFSEPVNETNKI